MNKEQQARRALAKVVLQWVANEFYADDHPEQPETDWRAEMLEDEMVRGARELVAVVDGKTKE